MRNEETRVKLVTAAVIVAVFAAGIVVGLALDRSFSPALAGPPDEVGGPTETASREGEPAGKTLTIIDRLDLDPRQRVLIDSVLDDFQARMAGFQKEYRPRYWALVDSSRAEVRQFLSEEQATLHDSLTFESDRRRGRPGTKRDGGVR